MKLNKILLIAISLISVCSFVSCGNDDDEDRNKVLIYSFPELNAIRKMPIDKVITKLENDGWSDKGYSCSSLYMKKTVNGYEYEIGVDPDYEDISLDFITSNQIDAKSIFKAENDFAGNKPNEIKIFYYDNDGHPNTIPAPTSDKSTIINEFMGMFGPGVKSEYFKDFKDYFELEFYYNNFGTAIGYNYNDEDGTHYWNVEINNL